MLLSVVRVIVIVLRYCLYSCYVLLFFFVDIIRVMCSSFVAVVLCALFLGLSCVIVVARIIVLCSCSCSLLCVICPLFLCVVPVLLIPVIVRVLVKCSCYVLLSCVICSCSM